LGCLQKRATRWPRTRGTSWRARAALEVLGGGPGRVGSGEDDRAEGATELHGLGRHARVGGRDEDRLEVRPVPGGRAATAAPVPCAQRLHHRGTDEEEEEEDENFLRNIPLEGEV
jgi:hypothetical protein